MKTSIALLLSLLCAAVAVGQHTEHTCATGTLHNQLLDNDTVYHRNFLHFEHRIQQMHQDLDQRVSVVHSLPVVVHIMHEGESLGTGSNITDEQIFSAITALNEDFRKLPGTNGDGDGVDVELEFCLAARDPEGNSTTGINRVDASVIANYAEMGIEATGGVGADETAVKALSTWPREDYLNIWVVNEIEDNDASGGIQGYAYFPTDNPNDGIVILHNAFGTVGNLKPNTDMNRTLTHEMGHSFGLYHTFHNTDACDEETNCETQGDRVCDTPPTPLSVSCTSPACDGAQQVENYLDYTSETCRNMFSQGQKDRMWSTLLSERATLINSIGCDPVSDLDAGINTIEAPIGGQCAGDITPEISIANYGTTTLTSVTIEYGSGSYTHDYTWSGSLTSGNSEAITLPTFTAGNGDQTFVVRTINPNGGTDEIPANDADSQAFSVGAGAQLELTVEVDFFGMETSWEIRDDAGELLNSGGPYINNSQGTEFVENMCYSAGCYQLIMLDDFGDGQSFTSGSYTLYDGGGNLLASGAGNWGETAVHDFCVEEDETGGSDVDPPVAGIEAESGTFCTGNEVDFTNTSTGESISIYSWTFEGGIPDASTQVNPNDIVWYTAGTYMVTLEVTNAGGTSTTTTEITIGDQPQIALEASDVSCPGAEDGSITAAVTGDGNYTFTWDTGDNGTSVSGLPGGYYTVQAMDGGCVANAGIQVDEPAAIELNLVTIDGDCSGAPGTASVEPAGGTGSYSVFWSHGATSGNAGDLVAGSYEVTVTDAAGCTTTETFSIAQAAPMALEVNTTDVTCFGDTNGQASLSIEGGSGSFDYNWSTGDTAASLAGLPAGDYSVTVLDDTGCSSTVEFTIGTPEELTLVASPSAVECHGEASGSIQATPAGGDGNYALSWSSGDSGTLATELTAGTYTATVTDGNGCEAQVTATVEEPTALNVSIFKQDVTCYGLADGSVQASATGGTGETAFMWDDGQDGFLLENIGAGDYTITASDANGCISQETASVEEPEAIQPHLTSLDIACGETFGSAYVDPEGGVGFYSVTWSNDATGLEINDLDAGTYSVEIADANGCFTTATFSIAETESLVLEADVAPASCHGMDDGQVDLTVNGGDGNYTFNWNNGETTASISDLPAGEYTVNVEDANGCTGMAVLSVLQPEPIELVIFKTDVTCFGENDGTASASATGGVGVFSFAWSNGEETQSVAQLGPGEHTATAKDQNDCLATEGFVIVEPSAITLSVEVLAGETCEGSNGSAVVNAMGGTGNLDFLWSNTSGAQVQETLTAGTYSVTATDSNGCSATAQVVIPFDCEETGQTTQLDETSCGAQNLMLDDFVYCVPVDGAQMYQWKFENLSVGLLSEVFSAENNPTFWLADVPGLFYNISVNVSVRVMNNDVWGAYSEACTITMQPEVPVTQVDEQDCTEGVLAIGHILTCEQVLGAANYEWRFTHADHIIVAVSYVPSLEIVHAMDLNAEDTYTVDVRAQVGPEYGPWGSACAMATDGSVGIDLSDSGEPALQIYPNPGNGDAISIAIENLPGGLHVIQCELYNAAGGMVETFQLSVGSGAAAQHRFHQRLSTGVYILRYTTETSLPRETRLMVQ